MNLIDIENMKAADLKTNKAQAVEAAKSADLADLAARYVQARLDAATRDGKLAEQGVTITSLNTAIASERERAEGLSELSRRLTGKVEELETAVARLQQELALERQARASAEALARARRVAVAEINAIAGKALVDG